MASRLALSKRGRGWVLVGALAVATAAPLAVSASLLAPSAPVRTEAACTAWFGSRVDGQCIANSNDGGGVAGGLPQISVGGPGSGNPGLSSGPLFPGNTFNIPIPVG